MATTTMKHWLRRSGPDWANMSKDEEYYFLMHMMTQSEEDAQMSLIPRSTLVKKMGANVIKSLFEDRGYAMQKVSSMKYLDFELPHSFVALVGAGYSSSASFLNVMHLPYLLANVLQDMGKRVVIVLYGKAEVIAREQLELSHPSRTQRKLLRFFNSELGIRYVFASELLDNERFWQDFA